MYGLKNKEEMLSIIQRVCKVLGNGTNNNADKLLLETAMAETGGGLIEDTTEFAGMGLTQFDKYPFLDLQSRSLGNRTKILEGLGVDIAKVQWEDLRNNPLLSFIFTRLQYLPFKEVIPTTLEGRAGYWKKYYNTVKGLGTVEHYIKMNKGIK